MFWNLVFQTCPFLEEIHGMCKHCLMAVFHIFLRNVYICLNKEKLSLLIFTFAHCHVVHSFVLLIVFSIMIPMFWFLATTWGGSTRWEYLGYSKGVFIISPILSSMLEIKVYSIIVSKVFGVTIVVNFLFAIVKQMFRNCKWVITIEKLELGSFGGEGGIMQFDFSSSNNAPRYKRFERLNSNKK